MFRARESSSKNSVSVMSAKTASQPYARQAAALLCKMTAADSSAAANYTMAAPTAICDHIETTQHGPTNLRHIQGWRQTTAVECLTAQPPFAEEQFMLPLAARTLGAVGRRSRRHDRRSGCESSKFCSWPGVIVVSAAAIAAIAPQTAMAINPTTAARRPLWPLQLLARSRATQCVLLVAGQVALLAKYLEAGGAGGDVGHTIHCGGDERTPTPCIPSERDEFHRRAGVFRRRVASKRNHKEAAAATVAAATTTTAAAPPPPSTSARTAAAVQHQLSAIAIS